jgi:hypothetical protein
LENGEYPADFERLGNIVKDIRYRNIENYLAFGFEEEKEL